MPEGADELAERPGHPALRFSRPQRKCRPESPDGHRRRGRLGSGASVPYRTGHFVAVPCAARRLAGLTAPRDGGSRWVVPRLAARRGSFVDLGGCGGRMPCVRLGPRGPWRRRMGSVGGWPLATPTTEASGGSRDGGPLKGRLPNRPSTRGVSGSRPAASLQPLVRVPVRPWGTWTGKAEARRDRRPASAAGGLPGRSSQVTNLSGAP